MTCILFMLTDTFLWDVQDGSDETHTFKGMKTPKTRVFYFRGEIGPLAFFRDQKKTTLEMRGKPRTFCVTKDCGKELPRLQNLSFVLKEKNMNPIDTNWSKKKFPCLEDQPRAQPEERNVCTSQPVAGGSRSHVPSAEYATQPQGGECVVVVFLERGFKIKENRAVRCDKPQWFGRNSCIYQIK